jgi:hypothetical protein
MAKSQLTPNIELSTNRFEPFYKMDHTSIDMAIPGQSNIILLGHLKAYNLLKLKRKLFIKALSLVHKKSLSKWIERLFISGIN